MSITSAQRKLEKEFEKAVKNSITWNTNNITRDVFVPDDFQAFNEMIGYPTSHILNQPNPMTWYQILLDDLIDNFHNVIVNKSRKIGITDTVLRSIAKRIFGSYQGHDIILVAGNKFQIAKESLRRLDELFEDKPDLGYAFREPGKDGNIWHHDDLIKHRNLEGAEPKIEFKNGTRVMAFAANKSEKSQPFRGADDVACIFLTEASHVSMKKDQSIMNALQPNLANRDEGDFILESTPNGRRGFFYNYWMDEMKTLSKQFHISIAEHQKLVDRLVHLWTKKKKIPFDLNWFPLMLDYKEGIEAGVLSEKFIRKERRNPSLNFEQEYCCKFTSTYSQAIDVTNLQFILQEKAEDSKQDLLSLIGKKGVQ